MTCFPFNLRANMAVCFSDLLGVDYFPSGQQPVSAFVARPVNIPGDGGASLLSDQGNPRWWSAIGSVPVHWDEAHASTKRGDDGRMETPNIKLCNDAPARSEATP